MKTYECFCGAPFKQRDELILHNVAAHGWSEDESRRKVMEKYPDPEPMGF